MAGASFQCSWRPLHPKGSGKGSHLPQRQKALGMPEQRRGAGKRHRYRCCPPASGRVGEAQGCPTPARGGAVDMPPTHTCPSVEWGSCSAIPRVVTLQPWTLGLTLIFLTHTHTKLKSAACSKCSSMQRGEHIQRCPCWAGFLPGAFEDLQPFPILSTPRD